MNRLTKTYVDGTYGVADTVPYGENSYAFKDLLIKTLGRYEDLEEQGLLIKLPCKVEDTVYKLENYGEWNGHEVFIPIKCEVDLIFVGNDNKVYCDLTSTDKILQTGEKFEEVALNEIYLTEEEAEKALEAPNE